MADSREAELEAEIRRLKARCRSHVDEANDEREAKDVYRRLAYRYIQRCNELEAALAAVRDTASDALASN